MDGQKKQKVLLGVLAVLVLGAGSFWYVTRDTGPKNDQNTQHTRAERKQRKKTAVVKKGRKRREQTKAPEAVATERKVREKKTVVRKERKKRTRHKMRTKKKAKAMKPAA